MDSEKESFLSSSLLLGKGLWNILFEMVFFHIVASSSLSR